MISYREKKERERLILSTLYVFGSTLIVFGILYLFNLLKFEDFHEYTGPVKITFGSPDVTEDVTPILKKQEIPREIEKPQPDKEILPEPEVVKEPEIVESVSNEIKKDTPVKKETKKPEVVKPAEVTPPAEPVPVIQNGRENGNSHETSFESSSSKIGRRAYFPISQFMPLPETVSIDIFSLIEGDVTGFGDSSYNRSFFKKYYSDRGSYYSLNGDVPLQNRPDLWAILDKAGYNLDDADYKKDRRLKPVIISFEINSNSGGVNSIKSAEIVSSSGDREIDEAVLYGFKQSTYSNSTDQSVKGRFKYSFN